MIFSNNSQLPATSSQTGVSRSSAWANMVSSFPYLDPGARDYLCNNPSLWRQIFPTAKQRMLAQIRDEMSLNALEKFRQFADLAMREDLNDRLIRGAATLRAETIKEAQDKLVEVTEDMSRKQQHLITTFQKNLDFCKSISSPLLREKYQDSLIKAIDEAFDTFEKLSKHFSHFLDTRIGAPAASAL